MDFQCFCFGAVFPTRITFRQWLPQRTDLPGRWDEVGCHFLPGASGATRVGKSFFFSPAFGRYLETDLCLLMDDRIGQWAKGCNECSHTHTNTHTVLYTQGEKKEPTKLRANKNLCIFIDMQSAVAGQR